MRCEQRQRRRPCRRQPLRNDWSSARIRGNEAMIHYSCDRCKRSIEPSRERRHVIKIEVETVIEPLDPDELDDDRDHLMEIHETLESAYRNDEYFDLEDTLRHTYDLCSECYHKFIRNPLAIDAALHLGFSHN
jgi:hypothetical protein